MAARGNLDINGTGFIEYRYTDNESSIIDSRDRQNQIKAGEKSQLHKTPVDAGELSQTLAKNHRQPIHLGLGSVPCAVPEDDGRTHLDAATLSPSHAGGHLECMTQSVPGAGIRGEITESADDSIRHDAPPAIRRKSLFEWAKEPPPTDEKTVHVMPNLRVFGDPLSARRRSERASVVEVPTCVDASGAAKQSDGIGTPSKT